MKKKNFPIVAVAQKYVGQTEITNNMGFTNTAFETSMEQVGWKLSYQWCAFFAELVWSEAFSGDETLTKIVSENFSGSAVKTFTNFDAIGMTNDTPVEGSVVIWRRFKNGKPQWTGHAGIVTKVEQDYFTSIEGNTNDSGGSEGFIVATKKRRYTKEVYNGLAVLGFINPTGYPVQMVDQRPFKNKTEGNKFRKWINDNYQDYAREIDLDEKGSHENSYIMRAYAKHGEEYETKD